MAGLQGLLKLPMATLCGKGPWKWYSRTSPVLAVTLSGENDRLSLPTSMRTVAAVAEDRRVRRVVSMAFMLVMCTGVFVMFLACGVDAA